MRKPNGDVGRPPRELAEILAQLLGKSGRCCLTVPLETIRMLASRGRLDSPLMAELARELAGLGIVFGHGRQVAILAEDVDFAPAERDWRLLESARLRRSP
jgi:hypothetical protein